MERFTQEYGREGNAFDLEGDLSTVACHAAIEIDNISLGHFSDMANVKKLVELILNSLSASRSMEDLLSGNIRADMLNPTMIVSMNKAFIDANLDESLHTVDQLVKKASSVVAQLNKLAADPQLFLDSQGQHIIKVKDFCLSLSKRAVNFEPSFYDYEPILPFQSACRALS